LNGLHSIRHTILKIPHRLYSQFRQILTIIPCKGSTCRSRLIAVTLQPPFQHRMPSMHDILGILWGQPFLETRYTRI
jgi:hypothetical protein